MDDNNYQNTRYVDSLQGNTTLPHLYTTARLSPLTITYFSYCMENGEYSVNLHFAEIQFTNDSTYRSLGRRVFNIFIQVIIVFCLLQEKCRLVTHIKVSKPKSVTKSQNVLDLIFVLFVTFL